jgi:hypothetical protein
MISPRLPKAAVESEDVAVAVDGADFIVHQGFRPLALDGSL